MPLPYVNFFRSAALNVAGLMGALSLIGSTHAFAESLDAPTVRLSLRTQWGLERFLFNEHGVSAVDSDELHLKGTSNSGRHRGAALSFNGRDATLYFTSKRTGRPAVAKLRFKLPTSGELPLVTLKPKVISIMRAAPTAAACGAELGASEARHSHSDSSTVTTAKLLIDSRGDPERATARLSPERTLEVATFADYEFYSVFGTNTDRYIRGVINAADALFAEDIGVRLKVSGQHSYSAPQQPIQGSDAEAVLESFRATVVMKPGLPRGDVHHLFTGRTLGGSTIGLAFVATACSGKGEYSFGLSRRVSEALQPLLAAHEIAHNLSASHDDTAGSIMNPSLTSYDQSFTEFSRNEIVSYVNQAGTCLGSAERHRVKLRPSLASRRTIFRAVATVSSQTLSACAANLIVGLSPKDVESEARRRTVSLRRIDFVTAASDSSTRLVFEAPAPPLPTRDQKVYFKVRLNCVDGEVSSPVKALNLRARRARARSFDSGRWMRGLRKRFVSMGSAEVAG